jgi:hypothetical protein
VEQTGSDGSDPKKRVRPCVFAVVDLKANQAPPDAFDLRAGGE